MSSSCTAFATKQELRKVEAEVSQKLDKSEAPKIQEASVSQAVGISGQAIHSAGLVLSAKIGANALKTKQVGTQVNTVAQTVGRVNSQALNAAQAAKKARFDALLAQSRASAAKAAATRNAGRIGSALGKISGIVSIIGTLATAAQLAILTKQVAGLIKWRAAFTAELNKRLVLLQSTAESAFAIANTNKEELLKQRFEINDLSNLSSTIKGEIKNTNLKISQIEKQIAATQGQISQVNIDVIEANKNATEAKNINSNLSSQVNNLKSENARLKENISSLKQQVKVFTSSLEKLKKETKNDSKTEDITAKRALELARTNQKNIEIFRGEISEDVKTVKEETLQERLRRERQEKIDAKFKSQAELRQELDNKINQKFQSQTKLRLDLQEQIIKKQAEQGLFDSKTGKKIEFNIEQKLDSKINKRVARIEQVNTKQAQEINSKLDNLNTKIPTEISVLKVVAGVGALQILKDIKNKPSGRGTCFAPALVPPVAAQAKANGAATAAFRVANVAQNTAIQKTVSKTQSIITNAKHGLEAIQNFADKAWKATHADKVLNAATTLLTVHNALMLSNNLGVTVGEAISTSLDALGINDSEGNPIDVNSVVRTKINELIANLIGEANQVALTAKLAKANRIYQAAVNMADITRELFDGAASIATLTAETITQISSEVVEFQDNLSELNSAKAEWDAENESLLQQKEVEKTDTKNNSTALVTPELADFDPQKSLSE